jgi:hypothetical protein
MKQEYFTVTTKLGLDLGGLQKHTNIPDSK